MKRLSIDQLNVKGKRVLVRVDFNVPLDTACRVTDDTRIRESLPTIRWIYDHGGRAVLMSHWGRPKGVEEKSRLKPAADVLARLIGRKVIALNDCVGPDVEKAVAAAGPGDIVLLENLRFHDEEEANDPAFSAALARLGDVFVNDAFGSSMRPHASVVGVTKHFKQCAAGFLMIKEIDFLSKLLEKPSKPFVAILGGAKVSTKIGAIEQLISKVNCFLVGGGMAFTFLKALGESVGDSIVEENKIETARQILRRASEAKPKVEFIIPKDFVIAERVEETAPTKEVNHTDIPDGWHGVDIGPKTIGIFGPVIDGAATIFWNGPLGVYEVPKFAKGTDAIAQRIAQSKAVSVVAGGDSIAAVNKSGMASKITHLSTGGGASLEYIEKGRLPGVDALTNA